MEEQPISPPTRVITIAPGECPQLDFSFSAEDPDINDTLTVRLYVDYPASSTVASELRLTPNGNTVRDQVRLTIDLSNPSLPVPARNLQQPGTHVVEALLFDFVLNPERKPYPITPAGDGGIENPSYVVSYAWVVEASHACPLP